MLYLKSLEIENVRCFGKKQRIDFTNSDGKLSQWTVILGDNGTGKTSILRSIVSLLPSPQSFSNDRNLNENEVDITIISAPVGFWDLRHKDGEKVSVICLEVAECKMPFIEEPGSVDILPCKIIHQEKLPYPSGIESVRYNLKKLSPVFCFAYGANRKMAEKSLADDSFNQTSETLFSDDAFLQNSSEYFLRLDYETAKNKKGNATKNKVKELLLKVLPDGVQDIGVFKVGKLQREVKVKTDFGWVRLEELSLGYKTTIAWLIDFATKMIYFHEDSDSPFEEPAILIIDEIDLHMHPSWQTEIMDSLSKIFPKTQFIVTAHSPLIVQAALDSNLVLLKKQKDEIRVINEPDIIKSWRIDQVLTSDLFGLKNSRSKKIEKLLARRRALLQKDSLTSREQIELDKLESIVDEIPVAETEEYREAMEIILKASKK